jgi:hypothetical protein
MAIANFSQPPHHYLKILPPPVIYWPVKIHNSPKMPAMIGELT